MSTLEQDATVSNFLIQEPDGFRSAVNLRVVKKDLVRMPTLGYGTSTRNNNKLQVKSK